MLKYTVKPTKVILPHNSGRTTRVERYWDTCRRVWVNVTVYTY